MDRKSTTMYTCILGDDHYSWSRRETIFLDMNRDIGRETNVVHVGSTLNGELIIFLSWTKVFARVGIYIGRGKLRIPHFQSVYT